MDDLKQTFTTTKGLKSLFDSFPRRCSECGHRYQSIDALLIETLNFPGSKGLRASGGLGQMPFVELIRQCKCGAPLIEHCEDRRDLSREGAGRREQFSHVLEEMACNGLIKAETIHHLRKVIGAANPTKDDA